MQEGEAPQEVAPVPVLPEPQPVTLTFDARGDEYFRIWIVNLALSVATLGIYSPWAKVRRKRYFHERTAVAGDSFDYRGEPLAILKGRAIAVVVAAVFYAITHFFPRLIGLVIVAAVFVVPFLMVRSYAFNAYNSAWRNIRFSFDGTYGEALGRIVGYGLLVPLSLGLAYGVFKAKLAEFTIRHHSFGTTRLQVDPLSGAFVGAYLRMVGIVFLLGLALGLGSVPLIQYAHGHPGSPWLWAVNIATYAVYLFAFAYIRSRTLNLAWSRVRVGPLRMRSTLRARRLWTLYATNILAMALTLGLFTPWAVVRTMRYRAESLHLESEGSLDAFDAATGSGVGATGEEVGEMLDMDFSL